MRYSRALLIQQWQFHWFSFFLKVKCGAMNAIEPMKSHSEWITTGKKGKRQRSTDFLHTGHARRMGFNIRVSNVIHDTYLICVCLSTKRAERECNISVTPQSRHRHRAPGWKERVKQHAGRNWCLIRIYLMREFLTRMMGQTIYIYFSWPMWIELILWKLCNTMTYTNWPFSRKNTKITSKHSYTHSHTPSPRPNLFKSCFDWHLRSLMKMQFYACFTPLQSIQLWMVYACKIGEPV